MDLTMHLNSQFPKNCKFPLANLVQCGLYELYDTSMYLGLYKQHTK